MGSGEKDEKETENMENENNKYRVKQDVVVFNASAVSGDIESDPACSVNDDSFCCSSSFCFPCFDRQDVFGVSGVWAKYFDNSFSGASSVMADFGVCFGVSSSCRSLRDTLSLLDGLIGLEEGWYWGDGGTYKKEDIEWLKQFFVERYPSNLPYPLICPIPTGGISVEWHGGNGVDLEVDIVNHTGEGIVYDSAETDFDVDFGDRESVENMFGIIRKNAV